MWKNHFTLKEAHNSATKIAHFSENTWKFVISCQICAAVFFGILGKCTIFVCLCPKTGPMLQVFSRATVQDTAQVPEFFARPWSSASSSPFHASDTKKQRQFLIFPFCPCATLIQPQVHWTVVGQEAMTQWMVVLARVLLPDVLSIKWHHAIVHRQVPDPGGTRWQQKVTKDGGVIKFVTNLLLIAQTLNTFLPKMHSIPDPECHNLEFECQKYQSERSNG